MKTYTLNQSSYLMESDEENQRLANKVNPERFIRQYLHQYITNESKIIDIGCGPATIAEQLARQYPTSTVTAIDLSPNRLIQASQDISNYSNLTFLSANIYQLPFQNNSFDLVFSRFLFEYLQNPEQALSEMSRICRPKGVIVVQDIDGQFLSHFPKDQQFDDIELIIHEINEYTCFDPYIGRKLYYYFYHIGLEKINIQLEPYHLIYGKIQPNEKYYWVQKMSSICQRISHYSSIGPNELNNKLNQYIDYLKREDSLTFSNLFTVYGRKPYGK